jgi:diguanylate cyclase (GGDEF)-like protein/PAS domain S-box-containing protein
MQVRSAEHLSGDGTLFHAIFAQSPEAMALTRARDGLIVDVNAEWVRLTGFQSDEVIGRTAVEIGHWPDEEARAATLMPLKQNGRIADADVFLTMKDGMARMVRMNAALVGSENDEYILIYLRDVTAERLAQEALCAGERVLAEANDRLHRQAKLHEEALVRLQESEARFRSLTELSSDWYWEQDEQFRFVRVDGNLETANVMPPEHYLGRTRWESGVQGVSQADWDAHRAALQAHEVFHDFEMQRLRNDGSVIWAAISGTPIFDAAGSFKGYRGTGRDISARKKAEADIERLAFFDSLTGLPNRRLLIDRLTRALDYSTRHISHGGLLFIDLDNFKVLNDTLGHHMGDELLIQVAQRLGKCVRSIDTVARLGGDEFVVMLQDLGDLQIEAAAMAETVGKKILSSLNQPFELAGQRHHSSPSIGITLFFQSQHTVDELLKRADLAMYQAKGAGRNTQRFFDPIMQAAATERANIEADLRQGLVREEFLLYYQPVVDEQCRMTGVEALVRWQHPARGMVSPADFIPVAEHTGMILPLGHWVLQTACQQLVRWSKSPATERLTIAVNVSTRQFRQPEFSDQLLDLLRETGANPYRLKLELTESLLLNEMDDAINKMTELRSIGVSFSLDDFGTGYSSLSYLKRLPLDQLKIDQSFVRDVLKDPNDAAIVRTILNLAANLDLSVVAEGVETEGQRDFLLRSGCKAFQGYLFGRPVPVDQLALSIP